MESTPRKDQTSSAESTAPDKRKLLVQLILGTAVVFAVVGVLGYQFRSSIKTISTWFFEYFGETGIFIGVLICEASPVPLLHEPFLILGISAKVSGWTLFWLAAPASLLGVSVAFAGGHFLRHTSYVEKLVEGRERDLEDWIDHYGVWTVAVAALSPLPFALSCWTVGALNMKYRKFVLASLFRIPRVAFYIWLLIQGWNLGA